MERQTRLRGQYQQKFIGWMGGGDLIKIIHKHDGKDVGNTLEKRFQMLPSIK